LSDGPMEKESLVHYIGQQVMGLVERVL
jgi:hypothetical protein